MAGSLAACSSATRAPIYVSKPQLGGLSRRAGDVIPYEKTEGFFCVDGDALEVILLEAQQEESQ